MSDNRRFRALLAIALTTALATLGIAALKSYRDFAALRAQEERLEARIAQEKAAIRDLEGRVELLDKDPVTLERLAREVLWMAKPKEVIIVLPPDPGGREGAPAAVAR
ncbi:MAG: septum formation initiator family protein [Thermoanaerobaculia bacterium]